MIRAPSIDAAARGQYIRAGQEGDSVRQIQESLIAAGYPVEPTSRMDRQTVLALQEFQRTHDCDPDAIVGPETLAALGFPLEASILESVAARKARRKAAHLTGQATTASPTALPAPKAASATAPSAPTPATPGGGHAFLQDLASHGVAGAERERRILAEVEAGRVPSTLTQWVDVPVRTPDGRHTGVIRVSPDYFGVGNDEDWVRMPMRPATAQAIADRYDAVLPTSAMVDATYEHADVRLQPKPKPPGAAMLTSRYFLEHQRTIEGQLAAAGANPGDLVGGHKKDLVVSNRYRQGRVTIYGWHQSPGHAIEPVPHSAHTVDHVDYSHGVRLVSATMIVDGQERRVADVLADPELAPLVSKEGVIRRARVD